MKSCKTLDSFAPSIMGIILFMLAAPDILQAQYTTGLWVDDWEVKTEDAFGAYETLADEAQNVYAIGVQESGLPNGVLLVKYDKDGNELWRQSYIEPGSSQTSVTAVEFDNKGNIVMTGQAPSLDRVVTISYTLDGIFRWASSYENALLPVINPRDLTTDTKGNSFVTGSIGTSGAASSRNVFVIKIDKNGVFQWDRIYDGPDNSGDFGERVRADEKGDVYVGGFSTMAGSNRNMLVLKYDKNGIFKWGRSYNGPDNLADQVSDLEIDIKGNVIAAGSSYSGRAVVKYDKNGNLKWDRFETGPFNTAHSLATDKKEAVLVTSTLSSLDGVETVKYDKNGNMEWVNSYISSAIERDVQVDDKQNVYVLGQVIPAYDSPAAALVLVYDKNGIELFSDIHTFANQDIVVRNLGLSCGGNFYFGAWDDFGANDLITVRYGTSTDNKQTGKCK